VDGLDQMWFTSAPLRVVARRALFRDEAHRTGILKSGLPSSVEPSDHIPIGAVFAWSSRDTLPDLSAAAVDQAAHAPTARHDMHASPQDIESEISALLAKCPFRHDAERAE
jgi:hypothetical protein